MKKLTNVIARREAPKQSMRIDCFVVASLLLAMTQVAFAAEKDWNADGADPVWTDTANWDPTGVPTQSDDAKVDLKDVSVDVPQDFEAQSLTIGGKRSSTVSVNNFVDGAIEPEDPTDSAVLNRRSGNLVIKGSGGAIVLKGSYKDSEEVLPEEPAFLLYVK